MGVELFGDWQRMEALLSSPRFRQKLRVHMRRANRRIGLQLVRDIRRAMRTGDYEPNSPLTVAMKGSSKPLVDVGDLFRGIGFVLEDDGFGVMVGVKRDAPARNGKDPVSIAAALHEGFTLDLRQHPQVRRAVFAKLRREGKRRDWKPQSDQPAQDIWVIPARPFIMGPVNAAWEEGEITRRWREAFVLALHDV